MEKPLKQSLVSKRFAPDKNECNEQRVYQFFVSNLKDDDMEKGESKPRRFAFRFGAEI